MTRSLSKNWPFSNRKHFCNKKWSLSSIDENFPVFLHLSTILSKNWPFLVTKLTILRGIKFSYSCNDPFLQKIDLLDSFFGFGVSSNDVILLSPELECPDTSSDTKFEFDEFESDTLPESVDDRVGWVPLESDWLESTKVVN